MGKNSGKLGVRAMVDERGIPSSISFGELVRIVEQYRGTTISFEEHVALDGIRVCGIWAGDGCGSDTIVLPKSGKSEVKLVIACHELGHMLDEPVDADRPLSTSPEIEEYLATVMNPNRRIAYARERSDFSDEREVAAEEIGDQLALRVLRDQRLHVGRDFQFERVFAR